MIVVDASALIAIVTGENDGHLFANIIGRTDVTFVPASAYLEAAMVLLRRPDGRAQLNAVIADLDIVIIPVDETAARLAADAFERYGKGRGHPARLNFGDCLSYGVAKARSAPLLYKGTDFGKTDIASALV